MKKGYVRFMAGCVSVVFLLTLFSGCGGKQTDGSGETTAPKETTVPKTGEQMTTKAEDKNYWEMLDSVEDSSDLPDWKGKQLKLSVWFGHGAGGGERPNSTQDVVTPEIKRVTGVELDREESFDNGGNSVEVKMGMLAAANEWPDLIQTSGPMLIRDLIDAGKLYDLTELLPKYAPNLMKLANLDEYPSTYDLICAKEGATASDPIYFVPVRFSSGFMGLQYQKDPDFDELRWNRIAPPIPITDWPRIHVRDDLLKKLYPNAKSQDEIEALYEKNGKFTKEEIFDVPIKSTADFIQFMRDMKALIDREGIKEDGRPVEVIHGAAGTDNWALMATFFSMTYGMPRVNYFTYFDKIQGKVVRTIDQPWFKDAVHDYQRLVVEGVVSPESLLDNSAIFNEKLHNGHYAIVLPMFKPNETTLKESGKNYRYRMLWPDVPMKLDQVAVLGAPEGVYSPIGIFKDSVKEEDLPQILRYMDYRATEIGNKVSFWGPRSAGLFTETNGKRVYTDKELEENMVYRKDNSRNLYYNLYNTSLPINEAWPGMWIGPQVSIHHPRYTYDNYRRTGTDADSYFQPAMLPGYDTLEYIVRVKRQQNLYNFSDQWKIFGAGRDAFEKALTAPLAARNDAQFEQLWQELKKVTEQIGLDESMMAETNKIFFENNPTVIEDAAKVKWKN